MQILFQMKYKPDRAMKIDSVVPAHGGASYNPDYDAHQHLLRQEDTKEEIRVSHEDKIRRKAKPPPKSEQVTEEDIFKESVAGLGIISDDEYETEEVGRYYHCCYKLIVDFLILVLSRFNYDKIIGLRFLGFSRVWGHSSILRFCRFLRVFLTLSPCRNLINFNRTKESNHN